MKLLSLAALAAASIASAAHAAETPLNLLFFGNSYSQGGLQYRIQDLAKADGHAVPNVVLDSTGGQDLAWQRTRVANDPTANVNHASIAGKTWDRVIIQANSTEALNSDGGALPYRADALGLFREVRDHASGRGAGVKAVQLQTWARGVGHSLYPNSFPNPAAMQAQVTANTALANADINGAEGAGASIVAPVGEAFGSFGWQPWLYQSDLHHPSVNGNLLESMVTYRAIYGEKVSDISFATWQANDRTSAAYKVDATTYAQLVAAADAVTIVAPEPASLAAITGAAGMLLVRRRRPR